jgi:hypothetical protein
MKRCNRFAGLELKQPDSSLNLFCSSFSATLLAAENFAMTGWHTRFFGFKFRAANPAAWSFSLGAVSALVAVGRFFQHTF